MPQTRPGTRSFGPPTQGAGALAFIALGAIALSFAACGGGSNSKTPEVIAPPPAVTRQAKWGLQWADEFDAPTLDAANWIAVDGAAQVNSELEYYTPSEVYIENGNLVLRSERQNLNGRSYTSGEVRSGTKRMVTRGSAVEWRTQIPSGKGIWPANWLVNSSCTGLTGCPDWPPEIDVMEVRGSMPDTNVMTHWWGTYPTQGSKTTKYGAGADLSAAFHTYRLEWFPDSVMWYVDGALRAKHTENVTNGQLQLVMNTAVGGQFDGPPNSATVFPQYHRIDYVRVYRDTANVY